MNILLIILLLFATRGIFALYEDLKKVVWFERMPKELKDLMLSKEYNETPFNFEKEMKKKRMSDDEVIKETKDRR